MRCIPHGPIVALVLAVAFASDGIHPRAFGQEGPTQPIEKTPTRRAHVIQQLARGGYADAALEAKSLHSTVAAAPSSDHQSVSDALCLLGFSHFLAGDLDAAAAAYAQALATTANAFSQIGSYRVHASTEQNALRTYHGPRAWTDNTGKHTSEACYVSHTDEAVLLSSPGRLQSVPLSRLSDPDREYLVTLNDYASERTSQKLAIQRASVKHVERLANPNPAATKVVNECLTRMAAGKKLVYEYTNVNVVTTWLNGTIPIGKELVFTKGRSEVPLDQGCKYATLYFALVNQKRGSVQGIESQISKVRSQISQLQAQQRQAQLQGVGFNANLLTGAQQALTNLVTQHNAELAAFNKMNAQLSSINKTMNAALAGYVDSYSKASSAIANATDAGLQEALGLLGPKASNDDGYGEALLFAQAALFARTRLQEARDLIAQHKAILESSDGIGFSLLNLNRLVLSALLGVEEDNSDVLRMISSNKDVMKHGVTCHALGSVYLTTGRYNSAESLLKRAYAKATEDSERFMIAADVCYTVLARDATKTVADVEKYIDAVQHPAGVTDWRVERAQAMLASADGEFSKALLHAQTAVALCPPAVEAELSRLLVSVDMGQRFSFTETDGSEDNQPVGLD